MDLTQYVEGIRREFAAAAEAGGPEARQLAERLITPLESAFRLAMLEVLADAAAEITRDLAPGSVDVRLRGREPSFVVTPPPADDTDGAMEAPLAPIVAHDGDDSTARINFRLPEHLKARIEEAAGRAGLSVNSWLVRAAASALVTGTDGGGRAQRRGSPTGGQSFSGWVQ